MLNLFLTANYLQQFLSFICFTYYGLVRLSLENLSFLKPPSHTHSEHLHSETGTIPPPDWTNPPVQQVHSNSILRGSESHHHLSTLHVLLLDRLKLNEGLGELWWMFTTDSLACSRISWGGFSSPNKSAKPRKKNCF